MCVTISIHKDRAKLEAVRTEAYHRAGDTAIRLPNDDDIVGPGDKIKCSSDSFEGFLQCLHIKLF